jgi:XTP/dITP diphosphohydrolase
MTAARITIVVATGNQGKLRELRSIFAGLPVELVSVASVLTTPPHVVEDGATFADNAKKKGAAVALATTMLTLADDSGLEVDALGGRPGVRSARFAHEKATDAENNAALLTALGEVDDMQRTARFRCELALFDPWGKEPLLTEGTCEGRIAREGRGAGGFGYDPLFLVTELGDRAMAELSDDEKNQVSHRGRAAKALRPHLEAIVAERLSDVERVSQRRPSILDR